MKCADCNAEVICAPIPEPLATVLKDRQVKCPRCRVEDLRAWQSIMSDPCECGKLDCGECESRPSIGPVS